MTPIRVLLVDDHAVFRDGLRTLLSVQPHLEVVGEAANGAEAVALVATLQPMVVLMDVQMPVLDGVVATRRVKALCPMCRVILLTTYDDDEYVFEGLQAGAIGYILKNARSDQIVEAIHAAAQGESILHPAVAAKVVAEFARLAQHIPVQPDAHMSLLSTREQQIIQLVARKYSNRTIADQLNITESTVKRHMSNILGKLGATDRFRAVERAQSLGLV